MSINEEINGVGKRQRQQQGYLFLFMYSFLQLFGQLLGLENGLAASGRRGLGAKLPKSQLDLGLCCM